MSVTKNILIRVAIGIEGIAILDIEESLSSASVNQSTGIHPALVLEDVKQIGVDEWARYAFDDIPKAPGVYTFMGSVHFDDDSANYSLTCDQV